ncbi:MAG: hypothetical protein MN733_07610, partial [Nitrososphaera sp.]|nr:hypothetical protein [Nitrososphaera sp.]
MSYAIYATILIGLVFVVDISTYAKRDDFVGIAQLAAGVSAICLALFSLVHVSNPKSNYLRLALATLSLNFVVSALLSLVVLVTT